ncbi:uncharacterized protein TNCT_161421 [Trichonephila clavata]|uniref:C2H2-type domain-containing protein n=1 Tax=Trichonephila clavata TaxID=2740835 RepID=A0A8X6HV19_TRICU|nr:uncharacterized protein TNCT_161421 [Trichonephila clavata]
MSQHSVIICNMCSNCFQTTSDLKNHLTAVHDVNDPKSFICVYCEKSFTRKFNLQRHMKLIHKIDVKQKIDLTGVESECRIEGNSNDPTEASTSYGNGYSCLEEGCTYFLKNRHELRFHLREMHDFDFLFEYKEFSNFSDFEMWKNIYEKEEQVHFVKLFGGKKVRSGRLIYFYCFRSGKHCSRSKGIIEMYTKA